MAFCVVVNRIVLMRVCDGVLGLARGLAYEWEVLGEIESCFVDVFSPIMS